MAERRRRRLSENDSGDEFSQDTTNSSLPGRRSECESEGEHLEPELSEYESTADESRNIEEDESETETESEDDGEDDGTAEEEDSGEDVVVEDEDVVDQERQSGDGEEQPSENLDDDEDKKNPAYIPRKGAFFEHDMRMDPDADERQGVGRGGKGRLWKDETKWIHDRYLAEEQAPKSRQELIALYGYDILSAERPPEAPPRLNKQRGPRNRKFQDFIPSDSDRVRRPRYRSDSANEDYDNDYPPVQSNYNDDMPRRRNDRRGQGQRGQRGSRGGGRGQRRNYSDLQEDMSQRNRQYSNRDRESFRNEDNSSYQDNYRFNQSRNRNVYDNDSFHGNQSTAEQSYSRRGFQDGRNRNRDTYSGGRDNYQDNRDDYSRNRDNNRGKRDNYSGNRDNFQGNRDNYQGNRENYRRDNRGPKDSYREKSDGYYGNRDSYRGSRDNFRYNHGDDTNQEPRYTQDNKSANYRDEEQNRRFNENQNYPNRNKGQYDNQEISNEDRKRRFSNDRGSRVPREELRENRSEETKKTSSYERESSERQYLKPEPAEIRSKAYDKMKSYYTLSPVADDEKLLNEGLEFENSANSAMTEDAVQDLNVTVSDLGNRKTYTKEKRGYTGRGQDNTVNAAAKEMGNMSVADEDNRKQQYATRHQPVLPPRLQQQERKKHAQVAPVQAPSPAPEKTDSAQRGSSKRYSSQRQRSVPEGPGYSESPVVPPPGGPPPVAPPAAQAPVPVQKLSEPSFFNPAVSPPKPAVNIRPGMMQPPPNFPPAAPVIPASTVTFGSPTGPAGPRVPSPQRVASPQILPARPPGPPPVFATTNTSEPASVASVAMIPPPPPQLPLGVMYAVPPPPTFQLSAPIPIPQFPAPQTIPPPPQPTVPAVPQVPQSQPQESVRGGTTYYSSESQPRSKTSGTTYYPPELQKKSRVTIRRPKVAIPIVNPEDMKKEGKSAVLEGMDEPSSASPRTPGPTEGSPLDTASIAALNIDGMSVEPGSPVSPGAAGDEIAQSLTISEKEETDRIEVNQNLESEQIADHGLVKATDNTGDVLRQNVGEIVSSVASASPENSGSSKFELDNRLHENVDTATEKGEKEIDLAEEIRTRTVSVSDKLIPEVKLEFKIQTDIDVGQLNTESVKDEQTSVVKTEVQTES